ncbi:helix-turn-helix domain-containing protein [Photorhabdus africana]
MLTHEQTEMLEQTFGCICFVYNDLNTVPNIHIKG